MHIAISAAVYLAGAMHLFKIPLNAYLIGFIGCATFLTYNLHRFIGLLKSDKKDVPERFQYTLNHLTSFITLNILILGQFIFCLEHLSWDNIFDLSLVGFITALYLLPVFPGFKRLRDIAWIKIFVIALVWAYIFILPDMEGDAYSNVIFYVFLMQFFFFLGLTLPFDIRDASIDEGNQLKTLANVLPIKKVIRIIEMCFLVSLILCIVTTVISKLPLYVPILFAMMLALLYFLVRKYPRSEYEMYYLGLLDGFILINGLIFLL